MTATHIRTHAILTSRCRPRVYLAGHTHTAPLDGSARRAGELFSAPGWLADHDAASAPSESKVQNEAEDDDQEDCSHQRQALRYCDLGGGGKAWHARLARTDDAKEPIVF